jgi:hypothetical protein
MASEYRQEAEKIRAMARQLNLNEARDQLLHDAKRLERMAEEEELQAQQAASHLEPKPEAKR